MNTAALFRSLLRRLRPDCVCDVGSLDGSASLRFRRVLPHATLFAFEANPHNVRALEADPSIAQASIEVVPCAVTDRDGHLPFHVADVDYGDVEANRGESSLLTGYTRTMATVEVEAVRLDSFLRRREAERGEPFGGIALWIDVEGVSHQAVEGLEGIRERVVAVHVEIDLVPYWPDEVPGAQTLELLRSLGFLEVGSHYYPDGPGAPGWERELRSSARIAERFSEYVEQASGNAVLVRADLARRHAAHLALARTLARARFLVARALPRR